MSGQKCSRFGLIAVTVALASALPASAADGPAKTRTVEAGHIKLTVPEAWQQKPANSKLRLAQFAVPKEGKDAEDGEFVVFYFGGAAGGVDANIGRWTRQFVPKGREVKITTGKSPQGEYVVVDLKGTYLKPVGPPIRQQTVEMPNARVVAVILRVKDEGNYFLRLTGQDKTTSANVDALRAAFGADAKSEKPYERAAAAE